MDEEYEEYSSDGSVGEEDAFEPSPSLLKLFEKKYRLERRDHHSVPSVADIWTQQHFRDDALLALKGELNAAKSRLEGVNLRKWGAHTFRIMRTGEVVPTIVEKYKPELCTTAWCKFFEILKTFPRILQTCFDMSSDGRMHTQIAPLRTVHLCEAPGAFICALNHVLQTEFVGPYLDWRWMANTLNPYHEGNSAKQMIDDVRFIRDTYSHWFQGKDNTGDLMKVDYILDLVKEVRWRFGNDNKVMLVTADGSIDCLEEALEQEIVTSSLHYCELVAALHLLARGGSFVWKMFTHFEHTSIAMTYLVHTLFEEVYVFKPATSKSGNSEVYLVCMGYTPPSDDLLAALLLRIDRTPPPMQLFADKALLGSQSIPSDFIEATRKYSQDLASIQRDTIENSMRLWQCISEEDQETITSEQQWVINEWTTRFRPKRLGRMQRLSHRNYNPRQFQQRQTVDESADAQQDNEQPHQEQGGAQPWEQTGVVSQFCHLKDEKSPTAAEIHSSWGIVSGILAPTVLHSVFCQRSLLHKLLESGKEPVTEFSVTATDALREVLRMADANFFLETMRNQPLDHVVLLQEESERGFAHLFQLEPKQVHRLSVRSLAGINTISELHDMFHIAMVDGAHPTVILCANDAADLFSTELDSLIVVLSEVIVALRNITIGGTFVIRMLDSLRRFSVGLLYVLFRLFREIDVVKPTFASPLNGDKFFCCKCYLGGGYDSEAYLSEVLEEYWSQRRLNSSRGVVEFIPILTLNDDRNFMNFIWNMNTDMLKYAIGFCNSEEQHAKEPTATSYKKRSRESAGLGEVP